MVGADSSPCEQLLSADVSMQYGVMMTGTSCLLKPTLKAPDTAPASSLVEHPLQVPRQCSHPSMTTGGKLTWQAHTTMHAGSPVSRGSQGSMARPTQPEGQGRPQLAIWQPDGEHYYGKVRARLSLYCEHAWLSYAAKNFNMTPFGCAKGSQCIGLTWAQETS